MTIIVLYLGFIFVINQLQNTNLSKYQRQKQIIDQYSIPISTETTSTNLDYNPFLVIDQYSKTALITDTTQAQIDDYTEDLKTVNQEIFSDILELQTQAHNLEIEFDDVQLNTSSDQIKMLETNQILTSNKNQIKAKIVEYSNNQLLANKFVNPLWGKTDQELKDIINEMSAEEKAG